ncbi:MAG: MarR family winged helix-turn-helix transcriptional regulator [Muricoprocola sp.]
MKTDIVKEMMDACYLAKRIRDMLPELPSGVAPSYIRFLDVIHKLERQNKRVKISDISDELNLPRPGVTRTVKEMEAKGYLKKFSSDEDGRITYIAITDEGERLSDKYNRKYFEQLSEYLDCISEEDAQCMIDTIKKVYEVMYERRIYLE